MLVNPPTGQWFEAADGQRWWFDSGSIAFDFAYTGGFEGPPEWERWHEPADVARWLNERFGTEVQVGEAAHRHARELRSAIAAAVVAVARDQQVPDGVAATIDKYAAMADLPPQLGPWPTPTPEQLLATIARDAVVALSSPQRVRTCAAGDCGVMYLDTSRSGSRTWCSMRRCGNRHKVRELRARRAVNPSATSKER